MSYLSWILETQTPLIRGIAAGDVKIPWGWVRQPFDYKGFPPALIPLWYLAGPQYYGIWKHWFCERKPTFVMVSPERGYAVDEFARTEEQLVRRVLLMDMVSSLGVLEPEQCEFAEKCGIDAADIAEIQEACRLTGDLPEGLAELRHFQGRAPADCFPEGEGYSGEFPSEKALVDPESLRRICSVEIPESAVARYLALEQRPVWLRGDRQAPNFERLLAAGDLSGAWMCLNSTGWHFHEARGALMQLAERAKNPDFDRLTECWLELDHESHGGY